MIIQLHVGTKADLSFNLRHFWPMKSFRRPRLQRKTDCHFKISGAIQGIRMQIVKSNSFLRERRGFTKIFCIMNLLSIDMGICVLETIFRIIYVFDLYFRHHFRYQNQQDLLILVPKMMISHNKYLHTKHFIITKFCEKANKVDLIKLLTLKKLPQAVCC